jgi:hypothetical protein
MIVVLFALLMLVSSASRVVYAETGLRWQDLEPWQQEVVRCALSNNPTHDTRNIEEEGEIKISRLTGVVTILWQDDTEGHYLCFDPSQKADNKPLPPSDDGDKRDAAYQPPAKAEETAVPQDDGREEDVTPAPLNVASEPYWALKAEQQLSAAGKVDDSDSGWEGREAKEQNPQPPEKATSAVPAEAPAPLGDGRD